MKNLPSPTIWEQKNPSGKSVWKVEATLGYLNSRPRRTRRTANSKAQAKELAREFLLLQSKGQLAAVSHTTVLKYGLYWVRNVKRGRVKKSTETNYEQRLRKEIGPYIGSIQLAELSAEDIEHWMQFLKTEGKSVRTINGARRVLFGVMKHAERAGLIFRNPVSLTDAMATDLSEKSSIRSPWSKQELLHALEVSKNTEWDLFLHMAVLLGLRRGEILGLQYSDIDFQKGVVHINGTLKEEITLDDNGKGTFRLVKDSPKTQSSKRVLGLSWPIMEAIYRHKELTEFRKSKAHTWKETDWVFKSSVGTVWQPANAHSSWRKFCDREGLRYVRIHDLRHTTAILALEAGLSLTALSETLGHSRIETTKNIYAANITKLSIEFPAEFAESLLPMDEQLRSELNRQKHRPRFD